ncbi:MAG: hypothetical protein KGL53_06815 [Elusimicrobia bacterium]|nr:hypothetical protein [Elusimicrobiota bacterium]
MNAPFPFGTSGTVLLPGLSSPSHTCENIRRGLSALDALDVLVQGDEVSFRGEPPGRFYLSNTLLCVRRGKVRVSLDDKMTRLSFAVTFVAWPVVFACLLLAGAALLLLRLGLNAGGIGAAMGAAVPGLLIIIGHSGLAAWRFRSWLARAADSVHTLRVGDR